MARPTLPVVTEAELTMFPGVDPGAPGAAVTTALCGHWEHEGPCRWPHNNAIETGSAGWTFRTLFDASADDEREVRRQIDAALRGGEGWEVVGLSERDGAPGETALAERLARSAGVDSG